MVSDPLRSPVFQVGRDLSAWPLMKVAQAERHLAALRAAIGVWTAAQPFGIDVAVNEDQLGAEWRLRVRRSPLTEEWSLYLGDYAHQLRSALDACIWDFATRDGRQPRRPRGVQFPIRLDEGEFERDVTDRIETVPAEVVARLRIVQPFNRPTEQRPNDGLLLLQELNNLDKHRSSIGVSVDASQIQHEMKLKYFDDEAAERNLPPDVTIYEPPFEDGALLGVLRARDPIEHLEGSWNLQVGLVIETSIGRQPLFGTFGPLAGYVLQVLSVLCAGAAPSSPTPDEGPEPEWTPYDPQVIRREGSADRGPPPAG